MNNRNAEIDGLRGWAALIVIFFHFFQETLGVLFPVFHDPIFGFILNGHLMVLLFFILSGDALSSSFFQTGDLLSTARIALVRYFRLTFIIIISCVLTYLLMKLQLSKNLEVAPLIHREDWLGLFLNFSPNLEGLFRYMLEGVYFHHDVHTSYNPFLWTMSVELLGSILVFANILILSKVKEKAQVWILCIELVFLWFFGEYLCLFIAGMLFGLLRRRGLFEKLRQWRFNLLFLFLFIILSFLVIPYKQSKIFSLADTLTFNRIPHEAYLFLWAGIIVFLSYSSRQLSFFFSSAPSRFLGDVSFPLYALQFNVLISVTSLGLLLVNQQFTLTSLVTWVVPIISILITIGLAVATRFFEKKFLNTLSQFAKKKLLSES